MNQLEKLNNINYNHSFDNGSLAISYMRCWYKINVGYGFLAGWYTKI
jgi:hypothetical protein